MKLENEIIESLLNIDFLSHSKSLNVDFEQILNLESASKNINGMKWGNICLEKIGDVTSYLSKNHRELYNKNWNNLAIEIKKYYSYYQ
ncbi:hypothetical protein [Lysinibacillus sp. 54212]|uniref:hypothetical protein n=1 Tax=Lysinibacillus sp. 54212 TaxID=3119829 RepID=UPI002FC9DA79